VDPFLSGWLICLFCFQPFRSFMDSYIAPRGAEDSWIQALAGNAAMLNIWAGALIVVVLTGLLADICLGMRFSYLTHRGIVTGGMYRFSKHPSYVMVVVQYALIYFPLFSFQKSEDIYKGFVALAGLALVYYLRARTEERHLSRDPVYVEYALWMNEHGALRWLGKLLPVLRYRAPADVSPGGAPYKGIS
jgi:isoprenylcysteine carboxyl methyltransferase (ICMT) family protein YpbQ